MRDYLPTSYYPPHPYPHVHPSMSMTMSGLGGGASGGGRMMRVNPMAGASQRHMNEPGLYPPSHYIPMPRGESYYNARYKCVCVCVCVCVRLEVRALGRTVIHQYVVWCY